jgi:putative transposase
VTLRFEGRRMVVSLQTEREVDVTPSAAHGEVGLDFGAKTSIMPSVGASIELPVRIGRYERRMRRLQRAVSRRRKGSNNRRKAVARLTECHRRIAAIRRDFLHQRTTQLVRQNWLLAIEDLKVKRMTASAAGTIEAPGKNVRAKTALNRTILRNGWGMARSMLEYKAAWRGSTLVAVPPAFTSQTCSRCGHVAAQNRPSQVLFECVACEHTENADRNAARNILHRAKEMLVADPTGGCPSRTAGYAGTHACEGGSPSRWRPRSAARGSAARLPLARTIPELASPGIYTHSNT